MSKAKTVAAKKIVKATKVDGVVKKAIDGQNPYRVGGGYWASVEALRAAGQGKMHAFDVLVPLVKKAMGDGYKAFAAKDNRNDETGKDAEGRIIQNISVVARKDYGKPLVENGLHVVFNGREKEAGLFEIGKGPAAKAEPKKAAEAKPKAAKAKASKKVAKADPTVCGRCSQPLKMFKDKGETEAKLTCPDCGWRHGDKKGVVSPKQIALAASATKAKAK